MGELDLWTKLGPLFGNHPQQTLYEKIFSRSSYHYNAWPGAISLRASISVYEQAFAVETLVCSGTRHVMLYECLVLSRQVGWMRSPEALVQGGAIDKRWNACLEPSPVGPASGAQDRGFASRRFGTMQQ